MARRLPALSRGASHAPALLARAAELMSAHHCDAIVMSQPLPGSSFFLPRWNRCILLQLSYEIGRKVSMNYDSCLVAKTRPRKTDVSEAVDRAWVLLNPDHSCPCRGF